MAKRVLSMEMKGSDSVNDLRTIAYIVIQKRNEIEYLFVTVLFKSLYAYGIKGKN